MKKLDKKGKALPWHLNAVDMEKVAAEHREREVKFSLPYTLSMINPAPGAQNQFHPRAKV